VNREDLAKELKAVMKLADKTPEQLIDCIPTFATLHRVQEAGHVAGDQQVHFVLYTLIRDYVSRLPTKPDGMAIRELLKWRDGGESQNLTTRRHRAAAHLRVSFDHFDTRHEPRLLEKCAQLFLEFDIQDRQSSSLDLSPTDPCLGLVSFRRRLDHEQLAERMRGAADIAILNTFIPRLALYENALRAALNEGARVDVLLLHPDSIAAVLRSTGIPGTIHARLHGNRVRQEVRACLALLATLAASLPDGRRDSLRVGLYDSLPSLAIYAHGDRALVSVFLHGHLAVDTTQIEICGRDTVLGKMVFGELEAVRAIAVGVDDLVHWERDIRDMRRPSARGAL
jgi:hypothetical protein